MKRKEFLKYSAGSFFIPSILNGFGVSNARQSWMSRLSSAAVDTDKVLVIVRLDGGNDGLNTAIPLDQYSRLTAARGGVIIPEDKILRLNGVDDLGLHPAMEAMRNLYNENPGFIINVQYNYKD